MVDDERRRKNTATKSRCGVMVRFRTLDVAVGPAVESEADTIEKIEEMMTSPQRANARNRDRLRSGCKVWNRRSAKDTSNQKLKTKRL